jgi:hypothetical protein
MQHFLKPASGAAGTRVIATELFEELLLAAAHRAIAFLHAGFAQGTPGAASTCAQKEERASRSFFLAILASLLKEAPI